MTAEEIVQQYPTLDLADIYTVIAYYLRNREDVDAYTTVMDQLAVQALTPADTVAFLARMIEGY